MRGAWLLVLVATTGVAAGGDDRLAPDRPLDYVVVDPPRHPDLFGGGHAVIYLDRCAAGCSAHAGDDDARSDSSSILGRGGLPAQVTLAPFMWDDATWDAVVQCMRDTYAIYDVEVVTDPPSVPHVEVMLAGEPGAMNLPANTLGISPLANDCSRIPSAIAFAFANAHSPGADLVKELCATAAHEAGHTFGLDHEFDCRDPMTYLTGCGQKVFLNRTVGCGEFDGTRPCKCGATQSSFDHLTSVIGRGALPTPDTVTIIAPASGSTVPDGFSVFVAPGPRPAGVIELWANGEKLVEVPGKATGYPYELRTSASLFDGFLDLEVRVYDDLGQLGVGHVTVEKGAACVDAGACPAGWTCDRGRCLAPPGTGQIGDACTSDGDCAGGQCATRGPEALCSQPCWPTGAACPAGLGCLRGDDHGYACYAGDGGGCCSTGGGDPRAALAGALAVGLMLARRRR